MLIKKIDLLRSSREGKRTVWTGLRWSKNNELEPYVCNNQIYSHRQMWTNKTSSPYVASHADFHSLKTIHNVNQWVHQNSCSPLAHNLWYWGASNYNMMVSLIHAVRHSLVRQHGDKQHFRKETWHCSTVGAAARKLNNERSKYTLHTCYLPLIQTSWGLRLTLSGSLNFSFFFLSKTHVPHCIPEHSRKFLNVSWKFMAWLALLCFHI